jgi:hypothetical protein
VTVCLSLFIPINQITILSMIAIAGGLCFLFIGFQLRARKRLLLTTPTCKIRSAALGLVEVNGVAAGPHTMPAPVSGKPCFFYHTTVWQQREGKKQDWEKIADETLQMPFFVNDSTGQLLIEPLGADLDVHCDFREEFGGSFFSSNLNEVPSRVSVFLLRHGIVPSRRVRIEERLVKPEDPLFIAGTLTENPGIQMRPLAPRNNDLFNNDLRNGDLRNNDLRNATPNNLLERRTAPEVIRLQNGADPSTTQEMSQQGKIAAALTRAGITRPEAWFAAGVPYGYVAVEENAPSANSIHDSAQISNHDGTRLREGQPKVPDFNLTPPVVLMKGANNPTFVISFRSQKEFVVALAWKSAAMIWGGAAITLLGLCMLLVQMELS